MIRPAVSPAGAIHDFAQIGAIAGQPKLIIEARQRGGVEFPNHVRQPVEPVILKLVGDAIAVTHGLQIPHNIKTVTGGCGSIGQHVGKPVERVELINIVHPTAAAQPQVREISISIKPIVERERRPARARTHSRQAQARAPSNVDSYVASFLNFESRFVIPVFDRMNFDRVVRLDNEKNSALKTFGHIVQFTLTA